MQIIHFFYDPSTNLIVTYCKNIGPKLQQIDGLKDSVTKCFLFFICP